MEDEQKSDAVLWIFITFIILIFLALATPWVLMEKDSQNEVYTSNQVDNTYFSYWGRPVPRGYRASQKWDDVWYADSKRIILRKTR